MLRPMALALGSVLVMVLSATGQRTCWPYLLVAAASLLSLYESFWGIYRLLRVARSERVPMVQVQACAVLLITTIANLALLNTAAQLAYPGTFEWRSGPASALDVVYLTLLTFASSGYGDVLPATVLGKLLSMLTSFAGLAYATIVFTFLWNKFSPGR